MASREFSSLLDQLHILIERTAYPVGTERTWKTGKFVKTKTGWVRVGKGSNAPKPQPPAEGLSKSKASKVKSTAIRAIAAPSKSEFQSQAEAALSAIDKEKRAPMATTFPENFSTEGWSPDRLLRKRLEFEAGIKSVLGKSISLEEIAHGFKLPAGYKMKLDKMGAKNSGPTLGFTIETDSGEFVGNLDRSFGSTGEGENKKSYVAHDGLVIEEKFQGKGISDTLNGNALRHYEKWGVDEIRTTADQVGRYAWARLGFNFATPADEDRMAREFEGFIDKAAKKDPVLKNRTEELSKLAKELVKYPWKLAKWDIGVQFPDHYSGKGTVTIGKSFLMSREPWEGRLAIDRKNEGYLTAISKSKVAQP